MKNLIWLLIPLFMCGCGLNATIPVNGEMSKISTDVDSQIFVYADKDIKKTANSVKTDDTTVIVIGVKDAESLEAVFTKCMKEVAEILTDTNQIYRDYVNEKETD